MSEQSGQNGQLPADGSVLWAWVAAAGGEAGVARLQKAWLPLGTINLVGFSREVLADPRLVEALQEQADRDGQTVRLVRFDTGPGKTLRSGPGTGREWAAARRKGSRCRTCQNGWTTSCRRWPTP